MKRGGKETRGHDPVGLTSGVHWYARREGQRARGAFAQVSRLVLRDVGRWIWWLRVPLLAPGALIAIPFTVLFMSPVLAIIFFAGYRKGTRLPALKDSFARASRRRGFTRQSLLPPRTHVFRNIRSLFSNR